MSIPGVTGAVRQGTDWQKGSDWSFAGGEEFSGITGAVRQGTDWQEGSDWSFVGGGEFSGSDFTDVGDDSVELQSQVAEQVQQIAQLSEALTTAQSALSALQAEHEVTVQPQKEIVLEPAPGKQPTWLYFSTPKK